MNDILARFGFFPVVAAERVTVERAYAGVVLGGGDVVVAQAGASMIAAAGTASVREGGCLGLVATGDVDIDMGGAGVVAARDITVRNGFVGMAMGGTVTLEDSKLLLGTAQAAAAGAALGGVLALGLLATAHLLVRRRR